jgi:SNF2 family DNA or RNA helicase
LIGRLYRQGQKNHVMIHHLVMRDTVDEAILIALKEKASIQSALLDYIKEYHEHEH